MREIIATKDFVVMEVRHKDTNRIVLPEDYDNTKFQHLFEVVYIGPECVEIEIGDGVVAAPEAIVKFQHNNQDYFLSREENVGAVIREMDK